MQSYSGFNRTDLYNQLEKTIWLKKFEESCHWLVEIDLSNWIDHWWNEHMIVWLAQNIYEYNPKIGIFVHIMTEKEKNANLITKIVSFAIHTPKSKSITINKIYPTVSNPHLRHNLIPYEIKDVKWVHTATLLLYAIDLQQPEESIRCTNMLYSYSKTQFYLLYKILAQYIVGLQNSIATSIIRCWHQFHKKHAIIIFHIVAILSGPVNWNSSLSSNFNNELLLKNAQKRMHLLYRDIKQQVEKKSKKVSFKNEKAENITTSIEKMDILFELVENNY